ncbi:SGNH/GDSL hydrolase family protein [Dendrosporobacter sp. 1207_IL3150]|uniref:SGNH/GDSL hydrolase family protein n=1 Tax=Dendrosporobacter sp. 1207_IL3150 TaxID=3084054 RepID=UPI002FDA336F
MKRILSLLLVLLFFIFLTEKSGIMGLSTFRPEIEVTQEANEYVLSWSEIPYLAYYEVEVLTIPADSAQQITSANQRIVKYQTWDNKLTIDQTFPFRTFWRVSAHGLFSHPIGSYSNTINLAQILGTTAEDFSKIKPAATSHYTQSNPSAAQPMLTWTVIPGAVYYEIEFLNSPPENPNDITLSEHKIFSSREVFTNGYNADLSKYTESHFYWRVRAIDNNDNPIGVFSDATDIYIDHSLKQPLKPQTTSKYDLGQHTTPLYPVYSWIPIIGTKQYEIEVLSQAPENPNGTTPSIYRIWHKEVNDALDCYDEIARITPGTYFWRVRGLDQYGNTLGVFSDAEQVTVDLKKGNYSATFGDSITHGGGAISYSPADLEYSFQTYLNFPTVNLGKSGDTSQSMAARFDKDVLPYNPRFLIILGGTNSLRGGISSTQVISDLTVIRDKCLAAGIRPIFLTLPPINPAAIERAFKEETSPNWREEFDAVNRFIRQQRYFIDLDPYFIDAKRELADHYAIDGLHPDIEGKKLIAQIINAHWERVTR